MFLFILETARDPARLKEAIEADRYWEKYLSLNSTVLAHTFQGQFKNTIICSQCSHISVSFEPFMYLSVPLPRANDLQIEVTLVQARKIPVQHLVTVSKHDTIGKFLEYIFHFRIFSPSSLILLYTKLGTRV